MDVSLHRNEVSDSHGPESVLSFGFIVAMATSIERAADAMLVWTRRFDDNMAATAVVSPAAPRTLTGPQFRSAVRKPMHALPRPSQRQPRGVVKFVSPDSGTPQILCWGSRCLILVRIPSPSPWDIATKGRSQGQSLLTPEGEDTWSIMALELSGVTAAVVFVCMI
ncbi:hypothetical protein IEO21_09387 [Rhodonia placenta]|uniref:Uncharacterized protein n=1 Tax=Rhodonia placenta TaxID=104341 RepID=A0A8H7TXX7_9APHY|nr:hypothetical protein IEO21_09387 [Postia placenta]